METKLPPEPARKGPAGRKPAAAGAHTFYCNVCSQGNELEKVRCFCSRGVRRPRVRARGKVRRAPRNAPPRTAPGSQLTRGARSPRAEPPAQFHSVRPPLEGQAAGHNEAGTWDGAGAVAWGPMWPRDRFHTVHGLRGFFLKKNISKGLWGKKIMKQDCVQPAEPQTFTVSRPR